VKHGRRSLVLVVLLPMLLALGILGVIFSSSRIHSSSNALRPCTTVPTWNTSERATLVATQRSHPATMDGSTRTITQSPYAYESLSRDIKGPGFYNFDFGPVPRTFRFGTNPISAGFNSPPDFSGSLVLAAQPPPRVVLLGAVRYFRVAFHVAGASCAGLRLWMS